MSGVAGDGQKDGILGERFRMVGFGAWRGRSVSGDAAHAEGGADGGEHGRSEVPEELDKALAVFRGHGWGLLSVWGSDIGFLSVQLRQRAPRRCCRPRSWP